LRRPRRAFRHTHGWRYPAPEDEPLSVTAGQEAPMGYLALGQQGIRRAADLGRRPPDSCLKPASLFSRNRRPDRLRLAARGETRARTIARRRQNRAAMPPRHHCAASRSTSACPWAVGAFYVSAQLAERRENGSVFGRCSGTFDAVVALRGRHGARRFTETGFLPH
jgi:hypothetical protein